MEQEIHLRNDIEKLRTPVYGSTIQYNTTFVGALYPEGNVQIYWNRIDEWTGQQFNNLSLLMFLWDTFTIQIGLPFNNKFSHLKISAFAEYYRQNMTTWVLNRAELKALGIDTEDYIQKNIERWGEEWMKGVIL